jgi:hypothetical protein
MAGSKKNIERCLNCGLLLNSAGRCSSCDGYNADTHRKSATIPDLARTKATKKKDVSKKEVKEVADIQVDFQSADGIKNKHLTHPAFLFNKLTKERFELSHSVSKVGRDRSNNISINSDHHISRYHAWILHNKGKFWVEDLGSTNGTLINGKPIAERVQIVAGDRITFGKTELIFVVD